MNRIQSNRSTNQAANQSTKQQHQIEKDGILLLLEKESITFCVSSFVEYIRSVRRRGGSSNNDYYSLRRTHNNSSSSSEMLSS